METLLVLAAVAAIAITVAAVSLRDRRKNQALFEEAVEGVRELRRYEHDEPRLLGTGTPASAEITSIRETGRSYNLTPEVVIYLNVEAAPGRAAYTAEVRRLLSPLEAAGYTAGSTVEVRVDPDDPTKLAIVPGTARAAKRPLSLTELSCRRCAATLSHADLEERAGLDFINCRYCGASYQISTS